MRTLKRIALVLVIAYFAIAAYGRLHKPEPYVACSCDDCDCYGPPIATKESQP